MKPKVFVAIALMLSLLVVGIILIYGYSSNTLLPVYLFSFLILFFAITVFITRKPLEDKIFLASIIFIIIAISATLFLTNLKMYYDIVNEYGNPDTSTEISLMQEENEYYSAYANYLGQRVVEYQTQSKLLESQLTELKKLELERIQQDIVVPEEIIAPIIPVEEVAPVIEYVYYTDYNEREVENDD
jgi:hypothetical protein